MRRLVALVLAGGAALLGAPSPTGATPHGWPTFGFDVQRRGRNPGTREVGPQQARRLTEWWSTAVGSAAINAQPVVALDVELPGGRPADVVFIAAEDGWITALDMSTGEVVWRRYVGAARPGPVRGCPAYPDQVFGVTGTPVIERSRGRIYVVGGDDRAYALRLADGATVPGWPVAVADPAGEHVWSALTLWRHVLYAAVASYCDMPPYTGAVVAIDTRGPAPYARWRATGDGAGAPDGGGVWGWGGVSIDPGDGDVYAATGNALTIRENEGYAERVVRLDRRLAVKDSNYPFRRKSVGDQDFGATPLLYRATGCPPQLAALNKNGEMLIYRRHALANGPVQRVRLARPSSYGNFALLGLPAYDAPHRRLYVVSPTTAPHGRFRRGLLAFRVRRDCRLAPLWRARAGVTGLTSAPVVARGVVYFATGESGELRAIRAGDGQPLSTFSLGSAQAFAAPTPVAGAVIAAGYDGTVRIFRPA